MNILVACEFSGIVRDAFRARGHDATSCDLLPSNSPHHVVGDVFELLERNTYNLVIAHPPCTYLSSSGIHWNKRRPDRAALTDEAATFFMRFTELKCAWAIENPVGVMSTRYRKPDQYIQPYDYGHDASKRTGLWLHNLPTLRADPRDYVQPRMAQGKPRWANQTDSGQNRLSPSPDRWKLRATFYQGWARAMASQWG
jgi:hypothetical protein